MKKKYLSILGLSLLLSLFIIGSCSSTRSSVASESPVKENFDSLFKEKAAGKKIMGYGNRDNQEFGSFNADASIFEVGDGGYKMFYAFVSAESVDKATYSGYDGEAGFAIDFEFEGDKVLSMLCYIEDRPSEQQEVVKTVEYVLLESKK